MLSRGTQRRNLQGRGVATRKFRRTPTTGKAHAKRVAFGKTWSEINRELAQQLRERTP